MGVPRVPLEVLQEKHEASLYLHLFYGVEFVELEQKLEKTERSSPKHLSKALFSCQNEKILVTVALSFVCGKYCPIID